MRIEILGSGCAKCHETERRVKKALEESGVQAEVVHQYDLKEIAKRGITFTPAVAIDGTVKISGRVPQVADIVKLVAP